MTPASKTPTLLRLPDLNETQAAVPPNHPGDESITAIHGEHETSMPHTDASDSPRRHGGMPDHAATLVEKPADIPPPSKTDAERPAAHQLFEEDADVFVRLDHAEADLSGTHIDVIEERKKEREAHRVSATNSADEPGLWLSILASRKVLAAALAVIAAWAIFGPRGQQGDSALSGTDQIVVLDSNVDVLDGDLSNDASVAEITSDGFAVDEGTISDSGYGTIAPPDAYVAKPSAPIETGESTNNVADEMDLFAPADADSFMTNPIVPPTNAMNDQESLPMNDMNDLVMSETNASTSMDAFLDQSNLPDLASQNSLTMASENLVSADKAPVTATSMLADPMSPTSDSDIGSVNGPSDEASNFAPLRTATPNGVIDWSQYLPPAMPSEGFPTTSAPAAPDFQYALPNDVTNPEAFNGPQARVASQPR